MTTEPTEAETAKAAKAAATKKETKTETTETTETREAGEGLRLDTTETEPYPGTGGRQDDDTDEGEADGRTDRK